MRFQLPRLYPILDASFLPLQNREQFLKKLVSEMVSAGVTLLQYRNKQGGEEQILADSLVLKQSGGEQVRLIMNDRSDLAARIGFDGVHVGQEDISPVEARRITGPGAIVGVSTHNRAQIEIADAQAVDYIAVGPVFATSTKTNPDPVIGLEGVREARTLTRKPLVAIGGITLENARKVYDAGADSVAVISALFGPDKDFAKIAKDFLAIFR
jgi:thiamine-phosphate pyrophosphorylase